MLKTIFNCVFIFYLGFGVLIWIILPIDFFFDTNLYDFFFVSKNGLWLANFFGILSIAIAIWDGQFIGHNKGIH